MRRIAKPPAGGKRTDPPATKARTAAGTVSAPCCNCPVVDTEKRARVCGAPSTTTREIHGISFYACVRCAMTFDVQKARGVPPLARNLSVAETAEHERLDAADDEYLGKKLRRGRDRGLL